MEQPSPLLDSNRNPDDQELVVFGYCRLEYGEIATSLCALIVHFLALVFGFQEKCPVLVPDMKVWKQNNQKRKGVWHFGYPDHAVVVDDFCVAKFVMYRCGNSLRCAIDIALTSKLDDIYVTFGISFKKPKTSYKGTRSIADDAEPDHNDFYLIEDFMIHDDLKSLVDSLIQFNYVFFISRAIKNDTVISRFKPILNISQKFELNWTASKEQCKALVHKTSKQFSPNFDGFWWIALSCEKYSIVTKTYWPIIEIGLYQLPYNATSVVIDGQLSWKAGSRERPRFRCVKNKELKPIWNGNWKIESPREISRFEKFKVDVTIVVKKLLNED